MIEKRRIYGLILLFIFCITNLAFVPMEAFNPRNHAKNKSEGVKVVQTAKIEQKMNETPSTQIWSDVSEKQNPPVPGPVIPDGENQIWLLAKLINAEARGEPYEGQVAVGAVIINRVKDPRFPNSVAEVIYKKGEFCTVRDGQINLPPNETALRAARDAMYGWDPTHGAIYFYNPAKTTSKWIYSRPVITKIGRHFFAA